MNNQHEGNMAAAAIDVSEKAKWDAYVARAAAKPKRRAPTTHEAPTLESQADALLARWATWVHDPVALGLPRQSVTETANTGGVMRGTPRAPSDMPDDVALTDRAVASLGLRHRSILRRVIYLHYERKIPVEGLASGLRMKAGEAKHTLERAQRCVWRIRQTLG